MPWHVIANQNLLILLRIAIEPPPVGYTPEISTTSVYTSSKSIPTTPLPESYLDSATLRSFVVEIQGVSLLAATCCNGVTSVMPGEGADKPAAGFSPKRGALYTSMSSSLFLLGATTTCCLSGGPHPGATGETHRSGKGAGPQPPSARRLRAVHLSRSWTTRPIAGDRCRRPARAPPRSCISDLSPCASPHPRPQRHHRVPRPWSGSKPCRWR